jgi:hypothetical protein
LKLEKDKDTLSLETAWAFFISLSIWATGSIFYHDDFVIPGISPRLAASLKQIRHRPKSLIKPLFLPQRKHLRTILVLNFGFLFDFAI